MSLRGQGMQLFRHPPINAVAANCFSHRAATTRNNLPYDCLKNNSFNIFKKKFLNQLYKQQCEKWIYFYYSKPMSVFYLHSIFKYLLHIYMYGENNIPLGILSAFSLWIKDFIIIIIIFTC